MEPRELIKAAQTKTGLSQNKLAEALGIRQPTLSQWNSGKADLSDDTYTRLAELAGIDPAVILIEKHARKAGPEAARAWARVRKALEAVKEEAEKLRIMAIM